MQVPTARFIVKKTKDYRWVNKLSIHLATLYYEYYKKRRGSNYAIRKYNGYIPNNLNYYNRVQKNKGI